MRLQLWLKAKVKEEDPDYIVLQKQRTGIEGKGYETVQVGTAYNNEAPSGEVYIDVQITGLTNNKP